MMYGSILVLSLALVSQVSDKPRVHYDKFDRPDRDQYRSGEDPRVGC